MPLTLTIENEESVPSGTPTSVSLGPMGGLDIGRGATQDWCLPDPSRFISSKHCEVRYRDGSYWLYDISANGTYLDSSTSRLSAPHRLQHGDRFMVGSYIIAVTIEADAPAEIPGAFAPAPEVEAVAGGEPDRDAVPSGPAPTATFGLDAGAAQEWREPARPESAWPEPAPARSSWDEPLIASHPAEHEAAQPAIDHGTAQREAVAPGPRGDEFMRRFAAGAGVPEHILARRDSLELAEELGTLVRLTTENLTQLLRARADVGRTAGVSTQTTVQALDNNPLKFSPCAEDALRIMFGPRTRGFLDARRAFEAAFKDLKMHQVHTFAAMQQAVRMLVEDFDPKAIDASEGQDHGLANLLGSRKARLWDIYVARWNAQTRHHDDGLAGAFLRTFGQCLDEAKGADMR